jgi:CRP-like cAMP-binding protein
MNNTLELFNGLADADVAWIFAHGETVNSKARSRLINEGDYPQAVWIVLQGTLGVFTTAHEDAQIAVIGPGDIVGEMAFLEGKPASASVIALEDASVLKIGMEALRDEAERNVEFAMRLYRALARRLSERLRRAGGQFSAPDQTLGAGERQRHPLGEKVLGAVKEFQRLAREAERAALKNRSEIPEKEAERFRDYFLKFVQFLNKTLGPEAKLEQQYKEELGHWVQRGLLPYILLSTTLQRLYTKPRGYPGDAVTLKQIAGRDSGGRGDIGHLLDECFHDLPVAHAIRNRRLLLGGEIHKLLHQVPDREFRLAVLDAGVAEEIFDVLKEVDDPARLRVTLVEFDRQNLQQLEKRCKEQGMQIDLHSASLVQLAAGWPDLTFADHDLIYSHGICDYLPDQYVVKLLNFAYAALAPGGRVLFGNFHPRNSCKAFMDYVLNWRLYHRDEADMDRLLTLSRFARPHTRRRFEAEQIDFYTECQREA